MTGLTHSAEGFISLEPNTAADESSCGHPQGSAAAWCPQSPVPEPVELLQLQQGQEATGTTSTYYYRSDFLHGVEFVLRLKGYYVNSNELPASSPSLPVSLPFSFQ